MTLSHYGHLVDTTGDEPYCAECEVPIGDSATVDGNLKARERHERTLEDGTEVSE